MFHYKAYGLRFASNRELPWLIPQSEQACDFQLELGSPFTEESRWRELYKDTEHSGLVIAKGENWYLWTYADGTSFAIRVDGRHVYVNWAAQESLENALSYFVGSVFRFLLILHHMVSLHASVVVIDDYAAIFVGATGMGKSTLAAAFAQLGFPLMSDDMAALRLENGLLMVERGFSSVKLWPDVASWFSTKELPRLIPQSAYWQDFDKRNLDAIVYSADAVPLRCIYFLRERHQGQHIQTKPIEGRNRLLQLLSNTNIDWGYILPHRAVNEFDLFSQIAESHSCISLSLPNSGNWRAYCAEIVQDFRQQGGI